MSAARSARYSRLMAELIATAGMLTAQEVASPNRWKRQVQLTIDLDSYNKRSQISNLRIQWDDFNASRAPDPVANDFELLLADGRVVKGYVGGVKDGFLPHHLFLVVSITSEEDGIGYRLIFHPKAGVSELYEAHYDALPPPHIRIRGDSEAGFEVTVDQPVSQVEFHWSADDGKTWVRDGHTAGQGTPFGSGQPFGAHRFWPTVPIPLDRRILVEFQVSIGLRCHRVRCLWDGALRRMKDPITPMVPYHHGNPSKRDLVQWLQESPALR